MDNIRDTQEYKNMDSYHACECAEGFGAGENATEVEAQAAWQYIWDTGLWKSLQGWYGRTVHDMVENGYVEE